MRQFFLAFLILNLCAEVCAAELRDEVRNLASKDKQVQERAVKTVLKNRVAAVPVLLEGLAERDPELRIHCLRLLRKIRSPASADGLVKALRDPDWLVRQEAIAAVSQVKGSNAQTALESILEQDDNATNRVAALRHLSYRRGKAALSALKRSLADTDVIVRLNAARELGRHGNDSGFEMATASIQSSNWKERAAAADALGTIGRAEAIPVLEAVTKRPKEHQRVRLNAIGALNRIKLIPLKPASKIDFLGLALRNNDWAARVWAAAMLLERGGQADIKVLKDAANGMDHPGREQATQALVRLKGED